MKRDKLAELEFQVKHRLLEYLKAAQLYLDETFSEEIKTTCPLCGWVADVTSLETPHLSWKCSFCGSNHIEVQR